MKFSSAIALGTCICGQYANALRLKAEGRHNLVNSSTNHRRNVLLGGATLVNTADVSYYTNITLNGVSFSALIDTGSSDLWVSGSVPGSVDSGKKSGVTYAIGAVEGPIKFADLDFMNETISKQAFIQVSPASGEKAGSGLIGLGPNKASNVYQTLNTTAGATVLDRLFLQNTSTPNILTVLLGRTEDPDPNAIFSGDISVGEVLDGYSDITNQPQLSVTKVPVRHDSDQHFQVLLDADGILGPDGKPISVYTEVGDTKSKTQLTAVLDTGFSLSQVPKSVADAIYSRISGAEYVNVTGIGLTWIVPCNQEVNITFIFGGKDFPIHPMDATLNPGLIGLSSVTNKKNQNCCIATFQPISFQTGSTTTFDIILGMSFLRNVYALFNYGDFITGSLNKQNPYIQFLSTTDPAEAHSDFVTVRLNGRDTTGTQSLADVVDQKTTTGPSRTVILALGITAIALAAVLAAATILSYRRRKNSQVKANQKWGAYRPVEPTVDGHAVPSTAPYQYSAPNMAYAQAPLYDPQANHNIYPEQNAPPLYDPQASYQNPWDHRH